MFPTYFLLESIMYTFMLIFNLFKSLSNIAQYSLQIDCISVIIDISTLVPPSVGLINGTDFFSKSAETSQVTNDFH